MDSKTLPTLDHIPEKYHDRIHKFLRQDDSTWITLMPGVTYNGKAVIRVKSVAEAKLAMKGTVVGSDKIVGYERMEFEDRLEAPINSKFIVDRSGYATIFNGFHPPYIRCLEYDVPIYSSKKVKTKKAQPK